MSKVREWAKAQGIEVGSKGRLPKSLIVDYFMAHPAEARVFLKDSGIAVGVKGRIARAKVEQALS